MRYLFVVLKAGGFFLLFLFVLFVLLLIIPEREVVPAIQPTEQTMFWEMEEGFRIAYHHVPATTDTTNLPLIYLHGGPGGYIHSSIVKTLSALAEEGHPVYLYDQRGSGRSDRMAKFSDVTIEKHLADLHEIIVDHIGAERVVLMGQSFGTILIAHYAARYPEKVAKMVLSSPGNLSPPLIADGRYVQMDSLYETPDSLTFISPRNPFAESNLAILKPRAIVASTGALLFDKKVCVG